MPPPRATFAVRLTPKSRAPRFEWSASERILHIAVTAPPVDGQANEALIQTVAKKLRISPGKVGLVKGEKSRLKTIAIEGLDQASVEKLLAAFTTGELE